VDARHWRRFLLRRFVGLLVTLLLTSFVIFASLYVAPGSPIAFLVGHHSASPAEIAAVKAQYHLEDPFFQRYWDWLTGILHGDFGTSIVFQQSVWSLISPRLLTSVMLVVYASLLTIAAGVGLGILAAVRGRVAERLVLVTTSLGAAIPPFVAAIFLLWLFAVKLGLFPTFGTGSGFTDRIWHLTLPAISLAIGATALLARYTRTAVGKEMHREHVETAQARGLRRGEIFRRHVLRNAAIPITASAGIVVATMIVAIAVVEKAFAVNGIGAYLIEALNANDFPVVQAIALLMAAAYVVLNATVDVLYAVLDPRVGAASSR
jgi:peptide/nickel transport system permease protein